VGGNEMGRKSKLFYFLIILLVGGYLLIRDEPYDDNNVDLTIKSISLPLFSVESEYYLDGGSINIKIVDSDNAVTTLHFSINDNYHELELTDSKNVKKQFIPNEDTLKYIYSFLEMFPYRTSNRLVLVKLRGRIKDYFYFLFNIF
jgi:hypothetical protein